MERRQCEECREIKPLERRYFPCIVGHTGTFQSVCWKCKQAKKRKSRLARIETEAIDKFSKGVTRGGSNIPHTAELLESIMNYFGGANGFSSLLMKQYFEAAPGSRIRNSILEMTVRLASKNTEQGGAKKPIDLYSEEELEDEINKRLEQAVKLYGSVRYVNAQVDPSSAAAHPTPALASGPEYFGVPEGRTEDFAVRVECEANRSLEALQAHAEADGVPPVPVERDAGDRGESVG